MKSTQIAPHGTGHFNNNLFNTSVGQWLAPLAMHSQALVGIPVWTLGARLTHMFILLVGQVDEWGINERTWGRGSISRANGTEGRTEVTCIRSMSLTFLYLYLRHEAPPCPAHLEEYSYKVYKQVHYTAYFPCSVLSGKEILVSFLWP